MTTAAVEGVWREMHVPLLRFIARRVADPRDAEDVLQDVMVRIQRHAGAMDDFDHVGAWVHQVTRSAIVDFYRRRGARPEQPAGSAVDLGEPELPRHERRGELTACLRPLMQRLPDAYREALELTEFEGISQVAAAERLGLSTSGMKARVQRARAQLREVLLQCCEVELDRRGGVADYRARAGYCGRCEAP
ncbi:MAG TPA: RNA polymerase sigma factor SigZ [Solirubrobacteraceae bacterium]|nr:RNA polymerase sigma factor SigZ [Solirubrobacteraceae bacterium]